MKTILITGGAGFIGVNTAAYFAGKGWHVAVYDDLSRPGADENIDWLSEKVKIEFIKGDVRDANKVEEVVSSLCPDVLIHLAGQVAVTFSVQDPVHDFSVNAAGTFNLLEAVRKCSPETFFINASTNKVYGAMENVLVEEGEMEYVYTDHKQGIDENQSLDFHSPYGCSKGCADQYTLDYSRIYDIRTTSFRQSCIYGTRQFGIEDQGWVAWFTIAAVTGKPITIFGNGKQSRDVLFVEDLIKAYEAAISHQDSANGQAFNIGGGIENRMSLLMLLDMLGERLKKEVPVKWADWRPGDQPVFVCDIRKAAKMLHWRPEISVDEGSGILFDWVRENREMLD